MFWATVDLGFQDDTPFKMAQKIMVVPSGYKFTDFHKVFAFWFLRFFARFDLTLFTCSYEIIYSFPASIAQQKYIFVFANYSQALCKNHFMFFLKVSNLKLRLGKKTVGCGDFLASLKISEV